MNFYYLYCLEFLNTGKKYIGYTNDLNRRLYDHTIQMELRQHPNKKMNEDYIKEQFEIKILEVHINKDLKYIQNREKELIEQFNTYKNGYNQTKGGEGQADERIYTQNNIMEAYAIMDMYPNESTVVVQELFGMSESAILRLKNKKTHITIISVYEKMSLDNKKTFQESLEKKFSLKQKFEYHKKNVVLKSRTLSKEQIFYILSIKENMERMGGYMERFLGMPTSHTSRIASGKRYKDYYDEYHSFTQEVKESLFIKAKEYFKITK